MKKRFDIKVTDNEKQEVRAVSTDMYALFADDKGGTNTYIDTRCNGLFILNVLTHLNDGCDNVVEKFISAGGLRKKEKVARDTKTTITIETDGKEPVVIDVDDFMLARKVDGAIVFEGVLSKEFLLALVTAIDNYDTNILSTYVQNDLISQYPGIENLLNSLQEVVKRNERN